LLDAFKSNLIAGLFHACLNKFSPSAIDVYIDGKFLSVFDKAEVVSPIIPYWAFGK
jgi:hypothetical protein